MGSPSVTPEEGKKYRVIHNDYRLHSFNVGCVVSCVMLEDVEFPQHAMMQNDFGLRQWVEFSDLEEA